MVLCIIALPIFAILGIFSLRYRMLAKESFRCIFRTIQLKPCDSGLDQKIKSKFTAKLMWWPSLARGFYRNFEIISWIFVILLLASTLGVGYGVYNYVNYGNCNGPESSAFCVFNSLGFNSESYSAIGSNLVIDVSKIRLEGSPAKGNLNSTLVLHEFGCYICTYTRKSESVVREVLRDYPDIKFVYHPTPLNIHNYSSEAAGAAICAKEQGKFWEYHELLFDFKDKINNSTFVSLALELGLDVAEFNECFNSERTFVEIERYKKEASDVGIYGTPTFVFGEEVLVGPQKYKTFKNLIENRGK